MFTSQKGLHEGSKLAIDLFPSPRAVLFLPAPVRSHAGSEEPDGIYSPASEVNKKP